MTPCTFIPPYLLQRVASAGAEPQVARRGHHTLEVDELLRTRRSASAVAPPRPAPGGPAGGWVVHSADNGSTLPGRPVRSRGEPATGDLAVDEAYAGVAAALDFFRGELGRDSFDGRGATALATVHYERDYANAFWDGRQLVFGDGDGRVFDRFTKPIDVLGHELTHAVVQYTAGLVYQGQSGALNEHVSDVFATCVKQRELGQTDPASADWLIGEGIFLPSVQGRALRSMADPGSAYDDPLIGRDPQVSHMRDYLHTSDDNGGVHLNSGIPNRAFHLAALGLEGPAWGVPARIWFAALDSGLRPDTDFLTFARATVAQADRVSSRAASVVAAAWAEVGLPVEVVPAAQGAGEARGEPAAATDGAGSPVVAVRRTGGYAGLTLRAELHLGDDPRTPQVERLLTDIRPELIEPGPLQPDRYVYSFWLCDREVTVAEQSLTPELSELAHLLLDD
jgi:Thermolysin metallopeptidase, alpha-helical domain/Thermolysin metallopeptidase, catalytic domain